jgi:regulator of replication initiation timing
MDIEKLQTEYTEKVQSLQKVTKELVEENEKLQRLQNDYIRSQLWGNQDGQIKPIYEQKDALMDLHNKYIKVNEELFVVTQRMLMCKDQILMSLNDKLKEHEKE